MNHVLIFWSITRSHLIKTEQSLAGAEAAEGAMVVSKAD